MKIKWGALVVDGRGKLGGHVGSQNRAGSYLRTKVTPSNPQTVAQTRVRALFGAISSSWSGMSRNDVDAWNGAVDEWKSTNIFGDLKEPSGKALYQRLNQQAQIVGFPAIATPPAKQELPDAVITAVTVSTTASTIVFAGMSTQAGVRIQIFATPIMGAGITFVKNQLRMIDAQPVDSYDPAAVYDAYVDRFGSLFATANIWVGYRYVLATGQATPMQVFRTRAV